MYAHRITTTITTSNSVDLTNLPFNPGEQVEIIILKLQNQQQTKQPPVSFAQAAKTFRGKIKNAPTDLSTNPDYLQGFGE